MFVQTDDEAKAGLYTISYEASLVSYPDVTPITNVHFISLLIVSTPVLELEDSLTAESELPKNQNLEKSQFKRLRTKQGFIGPVMLEEYFDLESGTQFSNFKCISCSDNDPISVLFDEELQEISFTKHALNANYQIWLTLIDDIQADQKPKDFFITIIIEQQEAVLEDESKEVSNVASNVDSSP